MSMQSSTRAAGVLAVLAAVAVGCGGPAEPASSAAPSSAAAGGAAASSAAASSTAASSTAPSGAPGAVAPGTGPAGAASASAIPESLLLPDEGGRSNTAEFTDWLTDNTGDRAWLLDACRPTAYPTDAQRTRFRTVERTGPEAHDARQLGVYPTPEIADEVVAGFRRALAACRTGGDPALGRQWTWVTEDAPDLGDDGFLAASTVGGPGYAGTGARIAVTRSGSAVFLAYATGEYYTAAIDGGARSAREVAQRFLDSL